MVCVNSGCGLRQFRAARISSFVVVLEKQGGIHAPGVGPFYVASRSSVPTPEEAGPPAGVEPNSSGLRLLAALQEEARLVDFVREDLDGYSDEEVGGAARGIHSALRKALEDRLEVGPILNGEDGDKVEVPVGFDPTLIRVTGSPQGEPPYQGVLRHGGWRASGVRLPIATEGSDPTVLAPAEVEVGEP